MGRVRCANGTDSHRVREEVVANSKETENSRGQVRRKRSENAPRECSQRVEQNPQRN